VAKEGGQRDAQAGIGRIGTDPLALIAENDRKAVGFVEDGACGVDPLAVDVPLVRTCVAAAAPPTGVDDFGAFEPARCRAPSAVTL
jgi:hypothetical protein